MEFTDAIVKQYEAMVADIAWSYTQDHTLHKDLMQEGWIGMRKACLNFDESRGALSTYAYCKIRAQMQQYLNYKVSVVHIPIAQKESGEIYQLSIDDHLEYLHYEDDREKMDVVKSIEARIGCILEDYIEKKSLQKVADEYLDSVNNIKEAIAENKQALRAIL